MAEYLAPGVFVEETSFRSKSIEGVSTSTTAFVGPTRRGPVKGMPELLTSASDFERIYGGLNNLAVGDSEGKVNYIAHAAAAYFNEGGARLYVVRIANEVVATTDKNANAIRFTARFPGDAGNGMIEVTMKFTQISAPATPKALDGSLLRIRRNPLDLTKDELAVKIGGAWKDAADTSKPKDVSAETATMDLLTVRVVATDKDGFSETFDDLGLHPTHKRFIGTILHKDGNGRADDISRMFQFDGALADSVALFGAFKPDNLAKVDTNTEQPAAKQFAVGGSAGTAGTDTFEGQWKEAFETIASLDDVSIIAAPGYTELGDTLAADIRLKLISHAETRRSYRIAVLDIPSNKTTTEAKQVKGSIDSKYAAVYYPWVVVPNPLFDPNNPSEDAEVLLPPSAFVCGIYARSDIERGVFKAPANEVIRGAIRFERQISNGEQELLNPLGVNCLRYFAGRGHRVWGARTSSSDPEWKYVNIRRYFLYLEHSIDRGTQWAVFEPNGERLWVNIRDTIKSFLYNEWVNGALLGTSPEQAFFIQCDRSTMTQNDLDNGRLVCLIGVAAIKPAEFVIFRIGQKTADARS